MIGVVVFVSLVVGFAVGTVTGYVCGLDATRAREMRADIRPALRRHK